MLSREGAKEVKGDFPIPQFAEGGGGGRRGGPDLIKNLHEVRNSNR